jgi:hypothetical protein
MFWSLQGKNLFRKQENINQKVKRNIFVKTYLSRGALCRSMSPNFNVPNINVLHINGSLLQP